MLPAAHEVTSGKSHIPPPRSAALTEMVMKLFEHWQLSYLEQAQLLSLATTTRNTIARYRRGDSTLATDPDTQDRVRFFLGMHKALRTIFPRNRDLVYAWPKQSNRHFGGRTPVQVMCEEGFLGVVRVYQYLANYLAN